MPRPGRVTEAGSTQGGVAGTLDWEKASLFRLYYVSMVSSPLMLSEYLQSGRDFTAIFTPEFGIFLSWRGGHDATCTPSTDEPPQTMAGTLISWMIQTFPPWLLDRPE